MISTLPSAKLCLLSGVEILTCTLEPHDYQFEFCGDGQGSGGNFAWGKFVRGDRSLELRFRRSLGLVVFHVGDNMASHEAYMRQLGVWGRNRYPGFSTDHLQAFRDLAHDLSFCADFLSGDAKVLLSAAHTESIAKAEQCEHLTAGYVGDTDRVDKMRKLFREKRYAEVVAVFTTLQFPHLLSDTQLRLVELARERVGS